MWWSDTFDSAKVTNYQAPPRKVIRLRKSVDDRTTDVSDIDATNASVTIPQLSRLECKLDQVTDANE